MKNKLGQVGCGIVLAISFASAAADTPVPPPVTAQEVASPAETVAQDTETMSVAFTFAPRTQSDAVVIAALFDSRANFDARRPHRGVRLPPGRDEWRIDDLAPGRYALLAYEDLDGDGELATDDRGLPIEPFTISGRGPARAPRFDRASFVLDTPIQRLELRPWRRYEAPRQR